MGKCKAVIKENPESNLERHVKRFHDKEYKEFHNQKLSALQQRAGASSSNEPQKKRMRETKQCAIDEMFSKTIQVKMNEKTLENACLKLVTINGRPFKLMDDSGFRKILNPLLEDMRAKFTVNAGNIHEKIGEKANDVRNRIRLEFVNDKDNSGTGTVNYINVEVFLGNLSFSHTSTPQAENIWKGVRCAAHTLELAVEDALKESFLRDVIISAR